MGGAAYTPKNTPHTRYKRQPIVGRDGQARQAAGEGRMHCHGDGVPVVLDVVQHGVGHDVGRVQGQLQVVAGVTHGGEA